MLCPSTEARYVANRLRWDIRSVSGSNLRFIEELTSLDPILSKRTKLSMALRRTRDLTVDEKLIIEEVNELLGIYLERQYSDSEDDQSTEGLKEIIYALCST